jgi:hypothetical protein
MITFLRRNLLVILFAALIASQLLTWYEVRSIRVLLDDYEACGSDINPCHITDR